MCGLQASHVREELVSGAVREGEQDLVYGEIKPTGRCCFFASLVSLGWHPPSVCRPPRPHELSGSSWIPGCAPGVLRTGPDFLVTLCAPEMHVPIHSPKTSLEHPQMLSLCRA